MRLVVRMCGPGIIPANTGRISHLAAVHDGAWDHPREYGENAVAPTLVWIHRGSSPRIRGECSDLPIYHVDVGIIPANTGRI